MSKLTKKQKEKIGAEIDSEGLGYWVQHYGDFEGKDEKLKDLIEKARIAMNNLENYLENNDILL